MATKEKPTLFLIHEACAYRLEDGWLVYAPVTDMQDEEVWSAVEFNAIEPELAAYCRLIQSRLEVLVNLLDEWEEGDTLGSRMAEYNRKYN